MNHVAAKHAKNCSVIDIATHNKQEFLSNGAAGSGDGVKRRAHGGRGEEEAGGGWGQVNRGDA